MPAGIQHFAVYNITDLSLFLSLQPGSQLVDPDVMPVPGLKLGDAGYEEILKHDILKRHTHRYAPPWGGRRLFSTDLVVLRRNGGRSTVCIYI
jgi:hypothetical protein